MGVPKVLIANRGEIAIRICRSAAELGWRTVALFTEKDASHASYADEAVVLDGPARYMDPGHLSEIAHRTGCTHVHPGYGFLSESPEFASFFAQDEVTFIGPSIETLKIASDKMQSRELATSLGVPVAPGVRVSSAADVQGFVASLGSEPFPVIIKALDGGGGRGIRIVNSAIEIEHAYKRCLGESPSKQIFVEKALVGPGWKHIEVQVVGDGRGNVIHLWERECSVQRRFQKIVELAPSTLERQLIEPVLDAGLKMARHLRYAGLGTFEFLVHAHSHHWVFLEVNPRIQVEHTVTEEIMRVDLVRMQLLLSLPGTSLVDVLPGHATFSPRGHAIQLRLVAEDPHASFRLSPGTIHPARVSWPAGTGIRVDTWLSTGPHAPDGDIVWTVGVDFDSLLAKLIVHAGTLEEVIAKARRAVREIRIRGEVKTNLELLAGVVAHPDWRQGSVHTRWLEASLDDVLQRGKEELVRERHSQIAGSASFSAETRHAAPGGPEGATGTILLQPGASFQLSISPSDSSSSAAQKHNVVLSTIGHNAFPNELSGTIATSLSSVPLAFSIMQLSSMVTSVQFEFANPRDATHIACPLAGKVVELHPALASPSLAGFIREGEPLVVVSVMKMESVVNAPSSGKVVRLGRGVEIGAVIPEGTLLCVLESGGSNMAKL